MTTEREEAEAEYLAALREYARYHIPMAVERLERAARRLRELHALPRDEEQDEDPE